jgi:hypothetical protein
VLHVFIAPLRRIAGRTPSAATTKLCLDSDNLLLLFFLAGCCNNITVGPLVLVLLQFAVQTPFELVPCRRRRRHHRRCLLLWISSQSVCTPMNFGMLQSVHQDGSNRFISALEICHADQCEQDLLSELPLSEKAFPK